MAVIGIDLGGTNIKGVIMNEAGEVLFQHYIPTTDDKDGKWKKNVKEMADLLLSKAEINQIGLSAPGLPNDDNTAIAYLPNRLHGLENFDWSTYLGKTTSVLNDAHAAAMAEFKFGAAIGLQTFVLLTLGTGVGGGLIIDGKLHQGLSQMAGHLGHVSINYSDDERSILGSPGSLEYAIGNYSIERRSFGKYKSTWELVSDFEKGDHFASLIWLNSIKALAAGINSFINILSPEAVLLSGGITLAGESLYDPLNQFLAILEFRPAGKKTKIIQAHFGDMSGSIGAASYVLNKSE
jgi:glucokinase